MRFDIGELKVVALGFHRKEMQESPSARKTSSSAISPQETGWIERALPDDLRQYYTEGQRAVLFIVATEIKKPGVCDLPIDKIALLAGVCRTTVQTTMHEARRLNHIRITERPVPGRL